LNTFVVTRVEEPTVCEEPCLNKVLQLTGRVAFLLKPLLELHEVGLDSEDTAHVYDRKPPKYQVACVVVHDIGQPTVRIAGICTRGRRGWRRARRVCYWQNWTALGYLFLFSKKSRAVSASAASAEMELDVLVLDDVGLQLGSTGFSRQKGDAGTVPGSG
jgi:hypothetical protein